MSIADEIRELQDLKKSGALSEEEFTQAKKKLLETSNGNRKNKSAKNSPHSSIISKRNIKNIANDESLGEAANRYVSFQIIMGIIGIIIFLIVFFFVILPAFNNAPKFNKGPKLSFPSPIRK